MSEWKLVVAPGVEPEESARAALEAARDELSSGVLFAAVVEGDEAWPRILDKEEAIEACRHGLVALRAVEPAMILVRGDAPASFVASARLLTDGRGYLVPAARASRRGSSPRVPLLRLLFARFWTRDERLWQAFRLLGR